MKISKKLREQAADLCAVAASYGRPQSVAAVASEMFGITHTEAQRGIVARVAIHAWNAASNEAARHGREIVDANAIRDDYAEAEAMLRTGEFPR